MNLNELTKDSFEITSTFYFENHTKIQPFINHTLQYFKLNKEDVRWYHYKIFCEKILKFQFVIYPHQGILSRKIAGSLLVENGNYLISYNANMNSGRQHFSCMHEIKHALFDVKSNIPSQSFSDLLVKGGYSKEELVIEQGANICASLLMCSDEALLFGMSQKWNSKSFMDNFEMSKQAVWYRVKNYLQFNLEIPESRSITLANAFFADNYDRSSFINILITFWPKLKSWMNSIGGNGISRKAFEGIYEELGVKANNSHYYQIKNLFSDVYFRIVFVCKNCTHTSYREKTKHCYICSSTEIMEKGIFLNKRYFEEENMMHYNPIKLDENSRAYNCPKCENEDLIGDKDYCHVCGTFIKNTCSGFFSGNTYDNSIIDERDSCDNKLPGNARFCHDCGAFSTYAMQNLLPLWNVEYTKANSVPGQVVDISESDLPF